MWDRFLPTDTENRREVKVGRGAAVHAGARGEGEPNGIARTAEA